MMKKLMTFFGVLITALSFSQAPDLHDQDAVNNIKITDFKVSVTVDSAEEIETVFQMKDLKALADEFDANEQITFEIICNGKPMSNGEKSKLSYKVEGNTNDFERFLKSVKKIRKAAINFYKP